MSHAPKSNVSDTASANERWRPSATLTALKQRAQLLQSIRQFFIERDVMEVETPSLSHTSVTDPFINSMSVHVCVRSSDTHYLQTSPEYAMKRLLAAGSGPIFQIAKAFRQDEQGARHNPEFTMLEWYRPGFDHHALMDEMDELLQLVLRCERADRMSYKELFMLYVQLDPHDATIAELATCASQHAIHLQDAIDDRDTWLMLIMSHVIEPKIGFDRPLFLYDFPASQSALARIQSTTPPVASRFEVYVKGIELANGFHELQDAREQRMRFIANLEKRAALGLPLLPIDELFLAALEHGLPDCAGVALGVDRLMMLAMGARSISDVISFDFERA